eukprot:Phypoly_transcript_02525.p1 GENE.Phypoly_transcript_02525~~Phypoly_transcript_02525.p1  ORF type:complete len:833 (+),score=92.99 Phypoly_transcript_02525:54-2552(+)
MIKRALIENVAQVHQGYLEGVIRGLFPTNKVLTDVRKQATITNPITGYPLELDIWLPEIKLCFEFQDPYHYLLSAWDSHLSYGEVNQKDMHKREVMYGRHETFIVIPCWWDAQPQSLIGTLKFQRPDVLLDQQISSRPIPFNPPADYFAFSGIPGVGELMLASFPMTLRFTEETLSNSSTWWTGEKYDGIRCCWNSSDKILYTRAGGMMELPDPFFQHMPLRFIDCEIWFGRGHFGEAQTLANNGLDMFNSAFLRVVGFDDPAPGTRTQPFEERYQNILYAISPAHPFFTLAMRMLILDHKHLMAALKQVLEEGGEGLVLRKPNSIYEPGRSPSLLKLKASRGDREGLVTGFKQNSVTLLLPEGTRFDVPLEQFYYNTKPKKGDIVTFTYESISQRSMPVNMKIYRIRYDLTWKEVLRSFSQLSSYQLLNNASLTAIKAPAKPVGFWSSEKGKNMRLYLEKFARSRNLDPLLASSWYSVNRRTFMKLKGAKSILGYYNGSLQKAVIDLFPEIRFETSKFDRFPRKYWGSAQNRRVVFENFAKEKGFDPLSASGWYKVTMTDTKYTKGIRSVLNYYQDSLTNAVIHLFPDVVFNRKKFMTPRNYWGDPGNRRSLFVDLAKEHKFDPLIPDNWTSLDPEIINSSKGARAVLTYYKGSYVKALIDLFPNIGLDYSKFSVLPNGHWFQAKNQRYLLKTFARSKKFDPLVPENWYSITPDQILSFRGASQVLQHHQGSLPLALQALFPEVSFDKMKFAGVARTYLHSLAFRKQFFASVATQKRFDPLVPENWYSISFSSLRSFKGANSVILYYNGSLPKALQEVFPEIPFEEKKFIV